VNLRSEFLKVLLAVVAASVALGSAYGLATGLKRAEAKVSHQQPEPDLVFEFSRSPTPEALAKGRRLFLSSCAHCHGADATGDEGPDLHDLQLSDRYIKRTILNGIKGEMPSFRKKHGSEDIAALTDYLRTLK
jgi:mono/diheme cytochrome c family protein